MFMTWHSLLAFTVEGRMYYYMLVVGLISCGPFVTWSDPCSSSIRKMTAYFAPQKRIFFHQYVHFEVLLASLPIHYSMIQIDPERRCHVCID